MKTTHKAHTWHVTDKAGRSASWYCRGIVPEPVLDEFPIGVGDGVRIDGVVYEVMEIKKFAGTRSIDIRIESVGRNAERHLFLDPME
jgi:hypothetical protein